jgi:hypothetical protein
MFVEPLPSSGRFFQASYHIIIILSGWLSRTSEVQSVRIPWNRDFRVFLMGFNVDEWNSGSAVRGYRS